MPSTFKLVTRSHHPAEELFDLSLSVDAQVASMAGSEESAVAGVTMGQVGPREMVTWRARHFGICFTVTARIMEFDRPRRFVDSQVADHFRSFVHEHDFLVDDDGTTVMVDTFTSPHRSSDAWPNMPFSFHTCGASSHEGTSTCWEYSTTRPSRPSPYPPGPPISWPGREAIGRARDDHTVPQVPRRERRLTGANRPRFLASGEVSDRYRPAMTSAVDPMASFRTLGRLLTVGLAAGGLIGAAFAGVLILASSPSVDALMMLPLAVAIGVVVGLVAGVATQTVTHVLVLMAVRVGAPARVPASVVPVVAAGGVAWLVPGQLSDMTMLGITVAVLTVVVIAAIAARTTAEWAVRPLVESRSLLRGAEEPRVG